MRKTASGMCENKEADQLCSHFSFLFHCLMEFLKANSLAPDETERGVSSVAILFAYVS